MGRFIISSDGQIDLLNSVVLLNGGVDIGLFKSATLITPDTHMSDLTEADYDGYNRQTAPMPSPNPGNGYLGLPNTKAVSGVMGAIFSGTDGTPQTVYGVFYRLQNGGLSNDGFLGAANCFDADPSVSLTGKTISTPDDVTGVLLNLRLWDYLSSQVSTFKRFMFSWPGMPDLDTGFGNSLTCTALDQYDAVIPSYAGNVVIALSQETSTHDGVCALTSGVGFCLIHALSTGYCVIMGMAEDDPLKTGAEVGNGV